MSKLYQINAPHILWLIRQGQVESIDDLKSRFPSAFDVAHYAREGKKILTIVDHLIAAGLVARNKTVLSPTPVIEKMQAALDISLTDLIRYDPESLSINPIFGKPHSINPKPDVFVLMPFADDLRPVYDDHIKVVASQLGLVVARADDFFAAHSIISDIWAAIYSSKIIIADCTGRNPNVFYEIGIAHTLGRPTILISQQIEDIPFDLRYLRFIVYEYIPRGMTKFNDQLRKSLEAEKIKLTVDET